MTVFSVNEGNIKRRIRAACDLAGITVTELGEKIGLSQPAFSQKLNNGRFTKGDLERVAEILGCEYICYFEMLDGNKIYGATVGEIIRAACVANNISITEVGKRIGISQQATSRRITTGKFTQEELSVIAAIANCSYESFFRFPNGKTV